MGVGLLTGPFGQGSSVMSASLAVAVIIVAVALNVSFLIFCSETCHFGHGP